MTAHNAIRAAILTLTCLALASCGIAYRNAAEEFMRTQPESAWGARPPEGHVEAERQHILRHLKDPESARIRPLGLSRGTIPASTTSPRVVPVWISSVAVNAKNSYGGYVGERVWSFFYSAGQLVKIQ